MEYEMWLPGEPPRTTAQTAAWKVVRGKPVQYKTDSILATEALLDEQLTAHRPFPMTLDCPVRVVVKWLYSAGRHKTNSNGWTWKTTRPDVDNMLKLLLDHMTKLAFWKDDNQVVSVVCEKFWVREHPGIWIRIELFPEAGDQHA